MDGDDWRTALRLEIEKAVDDAVIAGGTQSDIFAEILSEVDRLRAALERDPDPAEDNTDEIGEPSNDWPSAEP
ncbi:hypothetical protein [Shinella sp.]|uniref:hypothetical protein n=1 Tax=Shinella sp. TaxID=1870904 RepID=UPI003F72F0E2